MIIASLSNSVNATDIMLHRQHAAAHFIANSAVPADSRTTHIDVRQDASGRYQWVRRYRPGLLDGYSTETFGTAGDAACAAKRIAACDGVPVSEAVERIIDCEQFKGWEMRLFGQPESAVRNAAQRMGYRQRIVEETAQALLEVADQAQDEDHVSDYDWYIDDMSDAEIADDVMAASYPGWGM